MVSGECLFFFFFCNFELLFCRGPNNIVQKCLPQVQHAYLSSLDQSNFLICDVVTAVLTVDAVAFFYHIFFSFLNTKDSS